MARKMSATRQASEWNKANPVGTRVRYWSGAVRGPGRESTTRGAAFVQTSGHVSVHVEGYASSIALSHVEVIGPPASAVLGLDQPLTADDQRLIDDVTAPVPPRKPFEPPPVRLATVDARWGVSAGISIQPSPCGCQVVGVGTLPDPVRIEPCMMHREPRADDTAESLAGALDGFAIRLNKAPACSDPRPDVSGRPRACISRASRDGLGHPVGHGRMNVGAMCDACAALWHVQSATNALRRVALVEAELAAERARTA